MTQKTAETVCEYCATNGERGIKTGGACIMCGVGRVETPRIVAECWTCGGDHHSWCSECLSRYRRPGAWHPQRLKSKAAIESHRAAGHDVREVKP